jgi:hypothetical protein
MLNKADVDYVFTAASISNSTYVSREGGCCLLFARTKNNLDLTDRQYHEEIATDPQTQKYLGDTFMILPYKNPRAKYKYGPDTHESHFLIVTNEVDDTCRKALDESDRLPVTLVHKGTPGYMYGIDVRNQCSLPDKYIVGCEKCPLQVGPESQCILMRLQVLAEDPIDLGVEDYWEKTKYWKTSIGRFVAIGSTLTAMDAVGAPAHRKVNDHDFTRVKRNLEGRQQGAKERARYSRFGNEVCTLCAMKEACWHYGNHPRWCRGYYKDNLYDIARKIVRKVEIPFTGPQLRFLLANSGLLSKYVDRRKCYTTLRTDADGKMFFAVNPKTDPQDYLRQISNFDEAVRFLTKYRSELHELQNPRPMHAKEKAILAELSARTSSPTYYNGWRSTSYPFLYIASSPNSGRFVTTYRWGHNRGGGILPWNVVATEIPDIYANFRRFLFHDRTSHPLCSGY